MANRARGEVSIEVGGRRYILRPTFEAIGEIEDRLNRSLTAVMREFIDGAKEGSAGVRAKTIMTVILCGIMAANEGIESEAELADAIAADGYAAFLSKAGAFVFECITGGQPPGEAVAAARKKPVTRSAA